MNGGTAVGVDAVELRAVVVAVGVVVVAVAAVVVEAVAVGGAAAGAVADPDEQPASSARRPAHTTASRIGTIPPSSQTHPAPRGSI